LIAYIKLHSDIDFHLVTGLMTFNDPEWLF